MCKVAVDLPSKQFEKAIEVGKVGGISGEAAVLAGCQVLRAKSAPISPVQKDKENESSHSPLRGRRTVFGSFHSIPMPCLAP